MSSKQITIIGAGLSGSECALQLANKGIAVTLVEMKPTKRSAAHHSTHYAEIVCSNSLGNLQVSTASGLLKAELETLDCQLLKIAKQVAVPAGNALAVDRDGFAQAVTEKVKSHPNITCVDEEATTINFTDPNQVTVIATGPLTSTALSDQLQNLIEQKHLAFFDAASPIVTKDSINFDIAFIQDRYNRNTDATTNKTQVNNQNNEGETAAYINCPMNKEEYIRLHDWIMQAEKSTPKEFEKDAHFFESCMPIEELCRRGQETPRYGPMKPVGLTDPRTGRWPYAVVQLRQDNAMGTLYNLVGFQTSLKWGEQKTMVQLIPGLENAEVVRYGVMHRNTFINSPQVLQPNLKLKKHPNVMIIGQLTGVEGYTECIATGRIAAEVIGQTINDNTIEIPSENTMIGSLLRYITRDGVKNFQPINSNWGILPPLAEVIKDKKRRNEEYASRALSAIQKYSKQKALV